MLIDRQPAIFLDRDGVLIEEVGYLHRVEDLRLVPGATDAIRRLNEHGLPVVVITNQSVVARGLCTESDVAAIHAALAKQVQEQGARIDRFYYCPHHPSAGQGVYRIVCACRKPSAGLLHRAAEDLSLSLSRSIVVGDKASDLDAGWAVGCRTVLVLTGYGRQTQLRLRGAPHQPDHVAAHLGAAVEWMLHCSSARRLTAKHV